MKAPVIILVAPQMGENIGAAARAMKNFGLSELRIVAPRDGWPNPAATAMAAHATDIIEAAQVFDTLEEAVADLKWLFAGTARRRELVIPVYRPDAEEVLEKQSVGWLFGRENNGLSNDEVALCHGVIEIPANPQGASLNLAQAIVICAYSWFSNQHVSDNSNAEMAEQAEIHGMLDQLEQQLDAINYWRVPHKKPAMWQNLKHLLVRSAPTSQEVRSLRGLFRQLAERKPR